VVRQLASQPDWLNAGVRLPSGDLLFIGQQVSSTSWSTGTQELLLLSEAGQRWSLVSRPSNFSTDAAYASSERVVWLAGSARTGSSLSTGAIFRAVR
jgi:hypothetical protein